MDIKTLLGKTFTLTKFSFDKKEETISLQTLADNLDFRAFVELEGGYEKNYGFVTANDPYASKQGFTVEDISFSADRFAIFAFRYDIKTVDSSVLKRETDKAVKIIEAQYAEQGIDAKVHTKQRKELMAGKKADLLRDVQAKTKLIPIIFDRDNMEGYIFSKSEKAVFEILDNLQSVFDEFEVNIQLEGAFDVQEDLTVSWHDFLTWYWWRSESDQFFQIGEHNVFLGEDIELGLEGGKKITAKGASEQVRTAITEGATVHKILIKSENMVPAGISFVLNSDGSPLNIKFTSHAIFSEMHEEDATYVIDLVESLNSVFVYCKEVASAYKEAFIAGQVINQSVRNTWGRGDFCTKSFDDI